MLSIILSKQDIDSLISFFISSQCDAPWLSDYILHKIHFLSSDLLLRMNFDI